MSKRINSEEFLKILKKYGIKKLYHFTDRDNLDSIVQCGGLFSWADCEKRGIYISKPGGSSLSRDLDKRNGLEWYVRLSFTTKHPMMYVAMNEGRITNPIILEIDTSVILESSTMFSDMNTTRNGANVGKEIHNFKAIHFNSVNANKHFDLEEEEQKYFQAEVLVLNHVPLSAILNLKQFGVDINRPRTTQHISHFPYTAQITRQTPTAFIFLVDHSVSMNRTIVWNGEEMTLSEAVARIVNNQLNELILRCVKADEIRHYFDIAVIGYGTTAYPALHGELNGRLFVSPKDLRENPYKTITIREEKRTRRGPVIKEVTKVQWVDADHSQPWTHLHDAMYKAHSLLVDWIEQHNNEICYPPTVINITDGEYNGADEDTVLTLANELKSLQTKDGNVLFFNIHITPDNSSQTIFPEEITEIGSSTLARNLYTLSSVLPERYNREIDAIKITSKGKRYRAMGVNADLATLIKIMDIGTPTNIRRL